jgi:hypothetical protein
LDLCFDMLFHEFDRSLRAQLPAPLALPMSPVNMPYYCGPRITTNLELPPQEADIAYCQILIVRPNNGGL